MAEQSVFVQIVSEMQKLVREASSGDVVEASCLSGAESVEVLAEAVVDSMEFAESRGWDLGTAIEREVASRLQVVGV